jgi:thymidylate kinase
MLDSEVQLRFHYGVNRDYRLQSWLLRTLSPGPVRSYLLDVEPEHAIARKAEQFSRRQLEQHVALYRTHHRRLGVRRLDGSLPAEELCERIATDVWRALRSAR